MRVKTQKWSFSNQKEGHEPELSRRSGAAEGRMKADVVGFLTPCGDFIGELIDPRAWPTEADLTRCVTAEALCDISPNSAR